MNKPKSTLESLKHLKDRLELLKLIDDNRERAFILYRELLHRKDAEEFADMADEIFCLLSDQFVTLWKEIDEAVQDAIRQQP